MIGFDFKEVVLVATLFGSGGRVVIEVNYDKMKCRYRKLDSTEAMNNKLNTRLKFTHESDITTTEGIDGTTLVITNIENTPITLAKI